MVAPGSASAPLTSVACDEAEGGDIAGKGTVFSPAGDGAAGCVTTEGPAASVCTVSASADGVAGGCGTKAGASVCVAWEGAAGSAVAGVVGASVSAAPAVGSGTVAACGEVDTGCVDNGDAAPASGLSSAPAVNGAATSSASTTGSTLDLASPGRPATGDDTVGEAAVAAASG